MARLGQVADKVRSKNAGPFWLTVDIFCSDPATFFRVCNSLSTDRFAAVFGADADVVKRFEIDSLNVLKFSLPRPEIQGSVADRDMHGASWAALLADMDLN
jgi:hypothetical protein